MLQILMTLAARPEKIKGHKQNQKVTSHRREAKQKSAATKQLLRGPQRPQVMGSFLWVLKIPLRRAGGSSKPGSSSLELTRLESFYFEQYFVHYSYGQY